MIQEGDAQSREIILLQWLQSVGDFARSREDRQNVGLRDVWVHFLLAVYVVSKNSTLHLIHFLLTSDIKYAWSFSYLFFQRTEFGLTRKTWLPLVFAIICAKKYRAASIAVHFLVFSCRQSFLDHFLFRILLVNLCSPLPHTHSIRNRVRTHFMGEFFFRKISFTTVSYTHLTLPTIYSV